MSDSTRQTAILQLTLLSAATFGRGDGVAGLVDREVEHDDSGFPFLRGRTLKGLLAEAAEDFVFATKGQPDALTWRDAKENLFGQPGSGLHGDGALRVGDALLPESLRRLLRREIRSEKLTPADVLASLTGIRRQTAMNEYGAPDHSTLRSMRVVLRGAIFESRLEIVAQLGDGVPPIEDQWTLLICAALGLRTAGTGRNRGRGRMRATLNSEEWMRSKFRTIENQEAV